MPRGRPRIPDELHSLRGTYREDRHGPKDAKIKSSRRPPKKPVSLGKERTKIWNALRQELEPLGLWSSTYAPEIELFVRAYHRVLRLEADVDSHGEIHETPRLDSQGVPRTVANPDGTVSRLVERRTNPALRELSKWMGLLHQACSTLGLNPSSLSKLITGPTADVVDDLDEDLKVCG